MGYFSNGTEGMIFEEQFCARCVHNKEDDICPVLDLHMNWNYEQFKDNDVSKTKKMALDTFIVGNDCKMFVERNT